MIYKNCFCILTSLSLLEYFRLSIQQTKTLKTADFNGVLHVGFTPTQVNLEKKSQFYSKFEGMFVVLVFDEYEVSETNTLQMSCKHIPEGHAYL